MQIVDLGTLGYGNPAAAISREKQLRSGELTPEVDRAGEKLLLSGKCMVRVTEPGDGCIDGRPTKEIIVIRSLSEAQHREPTKADTEERRPLVAGGGYISMRPAQIAIYGKGPSAVEDLRRTTQHLHEHGLVCGAHTGSHANPEQETTDCGANDKFEAITHTAIQFQNDIERTVQAVYQTLGLPYDEAHFARAMQPYLEVAGDQAYFEGSTGTANLEAMIDPRADMTEDFTPITVKELAGSHKEDFIFLNFVEGTTLSQAMLAEELQKQFPDLPAEKLAQVFVVDVWRLRQLAQAFGETAGDRDVAFMVSLIYQAATAATLTDGSLRVLAGVEQPAMVSTAQK